MEQVLKDKGLLEDGEYLTETMEVRQKINLITRTVQCVCVYIMYIDEVNMILVPIEQFSHIGVTNEDPVYEPFDPIDCVYIFPLFVSITDLQSIKAATYATAETMDEVLQYEKLSLNAMNLEIVVTLAQTAFIASFQAIAPMMSPLLANKGINFEGPTSEEQSILAGHWVNVDQTKFNIAYRNLIVNAYKFTPQGGSIKSTVSIIDEETAIAQSYKKVAIMR